MSEKAASQLSYKHHEGKCKTVFAYPRVADMRLALSVLCLGVLLVVWRGECRDTVYIESLRRGASAISAGRGRSLRPGDRLSTGDIVMTRADESASVRTACRETFELFPDSIFAVRKDTCSWPDLADHWLRAMKGMLERIGPYDPMLGRGNRTAVIAVRG